ncbi:sigma-70 family RNA polymerase sigma factor [Methylobacillus arboreus]|uniref:sigma-70 family RNA polymerase sigma factor n=1 Tax=Methylobacillus arboreus TaxID=755170 RepID=UPI001E6298E9|nr:sigma-70 family RNA polymerase sigma factor [Methylobacillus arboreus]MCB5189493.1 sigma-70 family RNA polymerase sigma factor [Methylobacillus arboreus]
MNSPSTPPTSHPLHVIYQEHYRWLVQLLRRKLGNVEQAADLAQDTFTRILAANQYHDLREPKAYLTTVSTRLVAQHFRRYALEQAYLDALASQPEATSPVALVVEALAAISRVLEGLPARTREIFLLSQLDGMKYVDIARQLGISVNVVQKAMVKGFQHCYQAVYTADAI